MAKPTFRRRNGLSLTLIVLFTAFMAAQTFFGWREYNDEQIQHAQPTVDLAHYLRSGHFLEATAENWESEFLQMSAYVVLTAFLIQHGSAESKDPDGPPRDAGSGCEASARPARAGATRG